MIRPVEDAQRRLDTVVAEAVRWLKLHPAATERDLEILALVALGASNDEIADRLHVAVETVKDHLRRMSRRWGCSGRAHLVGMAYQLGYLKSRNRGGS